MTTATQHGLAPTRVVLPNDAVVLAKESQTTPAVTISAAFEAGTIADPEGQGGLAHFLSRVIDRGTERMDGEALADALDSRGVTLSISVTRHLLSIACTCLAEDFETILELIGDVAMRPTLPESEIETRRGEIVTAIRQDDDNPAVVAVERLLQQLYPDGHAYGRRPKGTVETVERIGRDSLLDFHRRHFSPASLSLVIVGDVEVTRAVDLAGRVFGSWRAPGAGELLVPPVPGRSARAEVVVPMMNKAQADIAYGFVTIPRLDPSYYAFTIMNNILGQYALGGRLGDNIRDRQGMAYYVCSAFEPNVGEGPLVIRAGVNPANVGRALAAIDEELRRMAAEGVTDRELAETKQYLIGSMPRTLETNAGIASFLQSAEHFRLGLDYDLRLPGLLSAVTREQVDELARRYLVPERAAVVVAGPYDGNG